MHHCVPIHQQLLVQAHIHPAHPQLQPFIHNGDEISDEGDESGNEKEDRRWCGNEKEDRRCGHVVCNFPILNSIHIMYDVCVHKLRMGACASIIFMWCHVDDYKLYHNELHMSISKTINDGL